ncbi:Crp/Fnr family transcriptional regulator [Aquimarina algicola]|uniref:Crp/Fnr family transcriptional regulator n=1 Tax=Aquimarina algicola TaxID=2589995 RepID=A0A504JQ79_9FLAO|nr:cyclic nucleotide-binding domain-containing protein [Aquimarina algicola]TPN88941.1 Crp/Fnr family transcriptional regulator [Aquimarina algicola]
MNTLLHQIKSKINLTVLQEKYLLSVIKTKTYLKNDFFIEPGQVCHITGYIEKGLMRVFNINTQGIETTNWLLTDQEYITEIVSFLKQEPTQEYIQCLEETTITYFSYQDLQDIYKVVPEMHIYQKLIHEELLINIKKYILSNIHLSSEERYEQLLKLRPRLIQKAPLKYIASFLGITDSTLSRVRRRVLST